MKTVNKFSYLYIFLFPVLFLCIILDDNSLKLNSYILYLFQLIIFILYIIYNKFTIKILFSPVFVSLAFILFYFVLGAYVTPRYIGAGTLFLPTTTIGYIFWHFSFYQLTVIIFLICNSSLFLLLINEGKYYKRTSFDGISRDININIYYCIFLLFILVLLSRSTFFEPLMFSSFFVLTLFFCRYLRKIKRFSYRLFFYVLIIFFSLLISSESKREIMFIVLLITFFEMLPYFNFVLHFSIKQFILALAGGSIILFLIIWASLNRGYGNYEEVNFLSSLLYVKDYINSNLFLDYISDNLELTAVYFNAVNCVEMFFHGDIDFLFGSTLIKPLFIFFPRELFTFKPESMINIYTKSFYPYYYRIDGSIPTPFYSELFLNTYIFLPLACYYIIFIFEKIYQKLLLVIYDVFDVRVAIYSMLIFTELQFVRGSGLDLLVFTCLAGLPMYFCLYLGHYYFNYCKRNTNNNK